MPARWRRTMSAGCACGFVIRGASAGRSSKSGWSTHGGWRRRCRGGVMRAEGSRAAAVLARVDHCVYAARDLDQGVAAIESLLGIRAYEGGRHAIWATRNALVALGTRTYLEIIAPDPTAAVPRAGRPFGLDAGGPSRLGG